MNETVNDIMNYIDILTSGKKLNDKQLKKLNKEDARELFLDFIFLLCYPEEHKFYNEDAIDVLIKDSKLLVNTIFKKIFDKF